MSNTSKITATIITRMITDFRFIGEPSPAPCSIRTRPVKAQPTPGYFLLKDEVARRNGSRYPSYARHRARQAPDGSIQAKGQVGHEPASDQVYGVRLRARSIGERRDSRSLLARPACSRTSDGQVTGTCGIIYGSGGWGRLRCHLGPLRGAGVSSLARAGAPPSVVSGARPATEVSCAGAGGSFA